MGQSLTATVFYGAAMPGHSDAPTPRLTAAAIEAIEATGREFDADDWEECLEEMHPLLSEVISTVRSGVGDCTWLHLAIADSVKECWDGEPLPVPAYLAHETDPEWAETIRQALACLEWVDSDYDDNGELIERVVDAPKITIGWHMTARYW